jgi:hypothetical protein
MLFHNYIAIREHPVLRQGEIFELGLETSQRLIAGMIVSAVEQVRIKCAKSNFCYLSSFSYTVLKFDQMNQCQNIIPKISC